MQLEIIKDFNKALLAPPTHKFHNLLVVRVLLVKRAENADAARKKGAASCTAEQWMLSYNRVGVITY